MKLSYLDLTTTDPHYNLAAEQYIFDSLPRDRAYFMLWQNDNAVIIGKHQNTLAEINEPYINANGVRVVRRLSGGGAVYHDLGNLNFTFITDAGDTGELDFALFCKPVIATLAEFGVKAEVNGRNDMTIDGRKFSGNAQYVREGRVMHHGTIMFDSDLSVVSQTLHVDAAKIRAKGVASVRSRVTNVREHIKGDVTLPEFRRALLRHVSEENGGERYDFTQKDKAAIRKLCDERYATWEWNYGASPECSIMCKERVEGCGTVEIYLDVKDGIIASAAFRGDFFSAVEPEVLARKFVGKRACEETYREILSGEDISGYFAGLQNEQFLKIINRV